MKRSSLWGPTSTPGFTCQESKETTFKWVKDLINGKIWGQITYVSLPGQWNDSIIQYMPRIWPYLERSKLTTVSLADQWQAWHWQGIAITGHQVKLGLLQVRQKCPITYIILYIPRVCSEEKICEVSAGESPLEIEKSLRARWTIRCLNVKLDDQVSNFR